MCGICGIVYRDPSHPGDRERLDGMRDAMIHRGPDDAGSYGAPGVGLGSRRLAILDLSERGHMPMRTADGRFTIVYNGEVYNYQELRASLESRGHRFESDTDTEVVLQLFAAEGPDMLGRLNGMFAFAIWDAVERRLFAARDRLGVKPFYYAVSSDALLFASEEKALFAARLPARVNHSVWAELLCFRFVAGDDTPFAGIRRLLPGHYLWWRQGTLEIRRWWNLADRARALRESPPRDPVAWYRETFDDAVRLRTISDVPLGVLLSGGLDSSSVAASLAQQMPGQVASFTVGFAEAGYDERPLARQVARRHQLAAHEIEVSASALQTALRQASWFNDEPLAHGNDAHLLAISQHAKPRVTVLLSGEGADETLGGYVRYRPFRHPALLSAGRLAARTFGHVGGGPPRWRKLRRFLRLRSVREFLIYNACDTLPDDVARIGLQAHVPSFRHRVMAEAEALYPGDLVRQAMYSDQHTFLCSVLDRNDRMTMGASIECRVPFLDYRLVEGLAALPTHVLFGRPGGKRLLRQSVGDRLPPDVLRHPKWGFGVPWKHYLRTMPGLRTLVERLPSHQVLADAPIERRELQSCVRDFLGGDDARFALVLQLLMVAESWDALHTGSGVPAPALSSR
jgi:asparagine synthase (glutamine-hydrolysing)